MAAFPAPTATYHHDTYDTINALNPELSQKGKNIAITGAGTGIGQAVALSFARAQASNLAIIGRTLKTLEATRSLIEGISSPTKVHIHVADISDEDALKTAFARFASTINAPIHTLVANAGSSPGSGTLASGSIDLFTASLVSNGIGTLNTLRAFLPHAPETLDSDGYRARIIHTSTAAVHVDRPTDSVYAVGKLAAVKYVQAFALENPDIWVSSFHPGVVETPGALKVWENSTLKLEAQDTPALAADWTVWAASKASSFISSGRFLWANWDVKELEEIFEKIKSGQSSDGLLLMGALPVGQRFTIGLSGFP